MKKLLQRHNNGSSCHWSRSLEKTATRVADAETGAGRSSFGSRSLVSSHGRSSHKAATEQPTQQKQVWVLQLRAQKQHEENPGSSHGSSSHGRKGHASNGHRSSSYGRSSQARSSHGEQQLRCSDPGELHYYAILYLFLIYRSYRITVCYTYITIDVTSNEAHISEYISVSINRYFIESRFHYRTIDLQYWIANLHRLICTDRDLLIS